MGEEAVIYTAESASEPGNFEQPNPTPRLPHDVSSLNCMYLSCSHGLRRHRGNTQHQGTRSRSHKEMVLRLVVNLGKATLVVLLSLEEPYTYTHG